MGKKFKFNTKGIVMKKLMMGLVVAATTLNANAIDISVTNVTCTGAYASGTVCDQLDAEVQNLVEGDLPDVSIGKYGTGISNANGFAYRGLGSDYSDHFEIAAVKLGGGLAVEGDMNDAETASGFGIGAAMTVGVNMGILPVDKVGPVEMKKLDVFLSFVSQNLDQDIDDATVEGDLSYFGLMARYHLIEGIDFVPGNMLSWGGVYLHTGIQRSSWSVDFSQQFEDETVEVSGQDATFGNSSANFAIESSSLTIPLEVSTYMRTAWALTFFGGAGLDIVLSGNTDVELDASGSVIGSTGGSYQTDISASESDSGEADATNFRAFGGLQLNLPFVRFTAQLNKGLGNDLVGFNAGIKVLY